MYRSTYRLRDEVRSMMAEVQLTDLTADELLSIIAVLAPARVRVRVHQPNNVLGLRPAAPLDDQQKNHFSDRGNDEHRQGQHR
jgi:hypothetical protein